MLQILLIEDDDDQAEICSYHLEQSGISHELRRATDGEQALDILFPRDGAPRAELPNLILLDLNLPRVDGHEVLRRIKADDELRALPVVILTSSNSPKDRARAHTNYANSYFMKPMGFDGYGELMTTLSNYWSLCQEEQASGCGDVAG